MPSPSVHEREVQVFVYLVLGVIALGGVTALILRFLGIIH